MAPQLGIGSRAGRAPVGNSAVRADRILIRTNRAGSGPCRLKTNLINPGVVVKIVTEGLWGRRRTVKSPVLHQLYRRIYVLSCNLICYATSLARTSRPLNRLILIESYLSHYTGRQCK
jgi:hypothetical protein